MPSQRTSRGRFRWPATGAAGVVTSVAGIYTQFDADGGGLAEMWLIVAGIALALLGVHALRKERALGTSDEALARAERGRRAAEARTLELAETSTDVLATHGP